MIFIFSLLIIFNEIAIHFCQFQNLFKKIIENFKSNKNYDTYLILNNEIQKIFNTKNESFSIPIYISILDLTHINILNISNDRDTYLMNYNYLLGVSDRVIYNKKKKEKEKGNNLIKVFLNKTIVIKNNSYLGEMIIKKIIFEKEGFNIDLYFLKNRYMSQYQNINKNNQKLFKFYDSNIVFFKDYNNLYEGIEDNELVILQKLNNDLNDSDITEIINKYIDNFMKDLIPIKLKNKIDIWIKVKNALNEIIKLKYSEINLHNFLLTYEIRKVKEKLENIEKNLLPVLYNNEDNEKNFIDFNNSIIDLKNYLEKYDLGQNDSKIDFYFSIATIIAIIIIVILCFKIYKEFKIAFYKKIK